MDVRRALALLASTLVVLAPAPAIAAQPAPVAPSQLPATPGGYAVDAERALRIAGRDPNLAEQSQRYGRLEAAIQVKDGGGWQVGYKRGDGTEVAQVIVDPATGAVRESWTGEQVAWPMARGYEGQFGHALNAWYVWIPLAALFFFGLFDFRRPWKLVHLDLLVLLSFGISHFFFN
ncbi:MAG: hypothetical protein ACRDLO_13630, partial [Solirubrobacterales bacterium]